MNTYTAVHNADTLKMYNGIPTHNAENWSLPTIPMGQNFTGVPVTVMNQSGKKFLLIQISGFVKPQEPRYVWTGDALLAEPIPSNRSKSLKFSNAAGDGSSEGKFWNPTTKIITGVLAIVAILGLLKWQKVI